MTGSAKAISRGPADQGASERTPHVAVDRAASRTTPRQGRLVRIAPECLTLVAPRAAELGVAPTEAPSDSDAKSVAPQPLEFEVRRLGVPVATLRTQPEAGPQQRQSGTELRRLGFRGWWRARPAGRQSLLQGQMHRLAGERSSRTPRLLRWRWAPVGTLSIRSRTPGGGRSHIAQAVDLRGVPILPETGESAWSICLQIGKVIGQRVASR